MDRLLGIQQFISRLHPVKVMVGGYLLYGMVGWLMLSLPFSRVGTEVTADALDHLFITVSAVSTTGLATVSVPETYSFCGQLIILLLIQIGGIGYMTLGSFVILASRRKLSDLRDGVTRSTFSLPEGFDHRQFVINVVSFTVICEIIGALVLMVRFSYLRVEQPIWSAIFHSISAFCTAGFSLYNDSFVTYASDVPIMATLSLLSLAGAIGFIVLTDVWNVVTSVKEQITLTSKIILVVTLRILIVGSVLLFLISPVIGDLPGDERIIASVFQTICAITTVGFNSVPIGELGEPALLLVVVMMIVGASPSGTGGGLKTTTLSSIAGMMRSTLRGQEHVTFWDKRIPEERLHTAVSALGFYVIALLMGLFLLTLNEDLAFDSLLFEATSAIGTVGLSVGITDSLSNLGKLTIIAMMFIGRLGPMTFGIALFTTKAEITEGTGGTTALEDVISEAESIHQAKASAESVSGRGVRNARENSGVGEESPQKEDIAVG